MSAATRLLERPTALRYVETSALLAALMEGDVGAAASINADGLCVASSLTFAEGHRAIIRARAMGRFHADHERHLLAALGKVEAHCDVIRMSDAILAAVRSPLPIEPVRTLDAIHLRSLQTLDEDPKHIVVVTRDKRIEANARAMGYGIE